MTDDGLGWAGDDHVEDNPMISTIGAWSSDLLKCTEGRGLNSFMVTMNPVSDAYVMKSH